MYYIANTIETFRSVRGQGHRHSRVLFILCLLTASIFNLTAFTNVAQAATYYVDPATGNINNDGSASSPWSTAEEVFANKIGNPVQPGDTILLRSGYHGQIDYSNAFNSDYITIQAQPGHTPTFKRIELTSCSKWIFKGLTISPEFASVFTTYNGLVSIEYSTDIIIEDNNIFSVQDASSWTSADWDALASTGIVTWDSPNVIIRNNTLKNINFGMWMGHVDGTLIEYNKVEHIAGDGFQIVESSDVTIQYNTLKNFYQVNDNHADAIQFHTGSLDNIILRGNIIIYRDPGITKFSGGMQGICVFDEGNINWLVENNVVIVTHGHGIAIYGATDSTIINNIAFYDPASPDLEFGGPQIHMGGSGINTVMRNNMAYDVEFTGTNITADHNIDIDDYGPDVLFVDYLNNDLRHKLGSPAIDAGSPDLAPNVDRDGNPRPQGAGYDIGAYEYVSEPPDTTPPSTPQNLSATAISEHQIDLTWDASTDPESGVSYYKIYRDSNEIDTSVSTSYSNTGLNSRTPYSYEVSAVNGAGLESGLSNTAQATTLSDTTAPSIVSVGASETSVKITFSESLDITSAEDTSNYSITGGISVIAASLDTDTVTLTTSAHTERTYTLTVENVQDTSGNPMTKTTTDYEYDDGLVAHWKFNDGGGVSALDSSGNSNTGTLINGPAWTGQGELSFDGIDDAVEIPTANWDASNGTIALWAKAAALSGTRRYLFGHTVGSWSNRIQLYADEGSFCLGLGDSHSTSLNIENLALQTWYHIALTWDGIDYAVYVDGIAKASGPYTGLTALNTFADIGNDGNASFRDEAFNGIIDEVRIYNRALTSDEVSNLALVFLPIDDKEVEEDSTLTFEVRTQDPNQEVLIESHSLPSDPVFFSNIFTWTPQYGDAGSYEVTFEAPHGEFVDFETITITVHKPTRPVYRFWSPTNSRHFYTIKEAEKDKLIDIYAHVWTFEGIVYYAFAEDSEPGLVPVYRFWSPVLVAHFYTISESERDKLINIYPHVWTYEGIAFYAYPEGQQPGNAEEVYRFWSPVLETHFYTMSETEKNKLIDNYPHIWTYEGIVWYAYE